MSIVIDSLTRDLVAAFSASTRLSIYSLKRKLSRMALKPLMYDK